MYSMQSHRKGNRKVGSRRKGGRRVAVVMLSLEVEEETMIQRRKEASGMSKGQDQEDGLFSLVFRWNKALQPCLQLDLSPEDSVNCDFFQTVG